MLFLKEKQVLAIVALRNTDTVWYLSKIARQAGATYVYITQLMYILEKKGLVSMETVGKRRMVKLTEKGAKIAALLDEARGQI
jgi:DNA-binding MarR family transcriptional regulator